MSLGGVLRQADRARVAVCEPGSCVCVELLDEHGRVFAELHLDPDSAMTVAAALIDFGKAVA